MLDYRLSPLGDSALLVQLDAALPATELAAATAALCALPGCLDAVPAYTTVTLHFDPLDLPHPEAHFTPLIDGALAALQKTPTPAPGRLVRLPVCYHPSLGPDLAEVAAHCGLSVEALVARHSAPEYRVRFLGFAPGFPFLEGLDPALATPRRATPRTQVAAGSVGIAGAQTGVYPLASPGGWQLIGQTPCPLVDFDRPRPTALEPGDRLKFEPISLAQFEQMTERAPWPAG
ncbi:5-oxoprolinase subunit PxpB [Ferrimonas balearica]|uniref:5-oxoprolinase subunit PxpB n=1 Tax=Ferrimonas balearica TaxID=44012 RepID=UPI001C992B06|nr:5-oxoprolinase subunit PxpB [Ferrimonas balearica]MBY5990881.1 5-oxoprolinase subunit PxpB [Ferrimonas balearica]